jgi:hypothetical protein
MNQKSLDFMLRIESYVLLFKKNNSLIFKEERALRWVPWNSDPAAYVMRVLGVRQPLQRSESLPPPRGVS